MRHPWLFIVAGACGMLVALLRDPWGQRWSMGALYLASMCVFTLGLAS